MSLTPEDRAVLDAKLAEWDQLKRYLAEHAKPFVEKEQALRKELLALGFPIPEGQTELDREGTNTLELAAGWKLKGTFKIDRKVQAELFAATAEKLREEHQINPDTLVRLEYKLETKAYKSLCELNPEAAKLFDNCLDIKAGSPTLELVPPPQPKE